MTHASTKGVLPLPALSALFFVSGFAALLYQVLWQKQLGYLLGSGAYATATTLAVFFLGLTLGQFAGGRFAAQCRDPLRAYALLELGIAASAASFFVLAPIMRELYPALFRAVGGFPWLLGGAQALVAAAILLLPAVLMGATLPVVAPYVVRRADHLARSMSVLYGANTIGGAAGALAAAFYLPMQLGLRGAYVVATGCNLAIAAVAYVAARGVPPVGIGVTPAAEPRPDAAIPRHVYGLAFASGFFALALQVVWTRMFAQVLHNSVYSFAVILVTFLLALGLGAAFAHVMSRRRLPSEPTLGWVLFAAGLTVAATPFVFFRLTDGLGYVARDAGWWAYIAEIFVLAGAVLFVPCVVLGIVFPYLLKVCETVQRPAGEVVGRIAAANTVGAIVGSVGAGFVLLPNLGMWSSVRLLAIGYIGLAVFVGARAGRGPAALKIASSAVAALLITFLDPTRLPVVRVDSVRGESLLSVVEGAHGTVAVVARGDDRRIKLDNFYTVGGTGSAANDRRQADLPLLVSSAAHSAFFLGIGTGITAGAALRHPVERVVAAELIPEIAAAAESYFASHTNGLFGDPRVEVVIADGRNYLQGTEQRFDVIVSDLFTPWQAGTASLYSQEHYRTASRRLAPGGLFAQWLPLYQLSQREFAIIANTMLQVFPQVTLWRGEFLPEFPIVALFGHADREPLDPARLVASARRLPGMANVPDEVALALVLIFYAGNLSALPELVAAAPLNTDDRPVIEYLAPQTQREERTGRAQWFTTKALMEFFATLQRRAPPEADPFLAALDADALAYVRAGLDLSRTIAYLEAEEMDAAREAFDAFFARAPFAVYRMFRDHLGRRFTQLFSVGADGADEREGDE